MWTSVEVYTKVAVGLTGQKLLTVRKGSKGFITKKLQTKTPAQLLRRKLKLAICTEVYTLLNSSLMKQGLELASIHPPHKCYQSLTKWLSSQWMSIGTCCQC